MKQQNKTAIIGLKLIGLIQMYKYISSMIDLCACMKTEDTEFEEFEAYLKSLQLKIKIKITRTKQELGFGGNE